MRFASLLTLLLLPLAAQAQTPEPIADAKTKPLGTVVTVAGRVTVANEFEGPTYLQDHTGGMPVFFSALHAAVQIGDSVVVTGALSEFQATTGQPGTGLKQISGSGVTFTVVQTPRKPVAPRVVRIADLDESLEGQLVTIDGVRFSTAGTFQGNASYPLTDGTATVPVYIDPQAATLIGAAIPTGPFRIVAVVGEFRGTRQIQPRTADDVGIAPFVYPGESVPKTRTFEVATWNVKFFGSAAFGTTPDSAKIQVQIKNAARVLRALDADLYGLQEIVSTRAFRTLLDSLNLGRPGTFRGFIAPIRQVSTGEDPAEAGQKTAFIYRAATVDSVSAGFLTTSGSWGFCCGTGGGGRYPYRFTFDARIEGTTRRITATVIHAKAGAAVADYDARTGDFAALKAALDARPNEALILLGDYNDDVDVSIVAGRPSTYAALAQHTADVCDATKPYCTVSRRLSEGNQQTTGGGQVIDHLTISNELYADYFKGTVRIENPSYIPSYLSTTSDHYPVWARFDLARITAAERAPRAGTDLLTALYPNPARTRLVVGAAVAGTTFTLFDMLGRAVAQAGATTPGEVSLDLSGVAPGVYVLHLAAGGRTAARTVVVAR